MKTSITLDDALAAFDQHFAGHNFSEHFRAAACIAEYLTQLEQLVPEADRRICRAAAERYANDPSDPTGHVQDCDKVDGAGNALAEDEDDGLDECNDDCADHAPDCDGNCDHIEHQNMCWPLWQQTHPPGRSVAEAKQWLSDTDSNILPHAGILFEYITQLERIAALVHTTGRDGVTEATLAAEEWAASEED